MWLAGGASGRTGLGLSALVGALTIDREFELTGRTPMSLGANTAWATAQLAWSLYGPHLGY